MTTPKPSQAKVAEHARIHLGASGPVSLTSLKKWLLDQTPGVTKANVHSIACRFIRQAEDDGTIDIEGDDVNGFFYSLKN